MRHFESILIPLITIAFGCFFVTKLFRAGRLLTPIGGLHLMAVVFMGAGPLAYAFVEPDGERVSAALLESCANKTAVLFVLGYAGAGLLELYIRSTRKSQKVLRPVKVPRLRGTSVILLVLL